MTALNTTALRASLVPEFIEYLRGEGCFPESTSFPENAARQVVEYQNSVCAELVDIVIKVLEQAGISFYTPSSASAQPFVSEEFLQGAREGLEEQLQLPGIDWAKF